ncbi:expansin EXLX1 family cellulose-binding protein [Actinoplanes sp. NPDC051633]|uniref:expansin EXLX1 family cellulose-binding protein n=1 Tax=Actinoplanes sp. NPDC051633 TaxID=3155670 RepID=UPI0034180B85
MTAHRLFSARWLTTGGAVILAAVLGVAILLRQGDPACAAAAAKATFFDLKGTGHCSFPKPPADDLFVALGHGVYDDAAPCGSYYDVTGPKGKVRVKVIDSCPECADNHLDLSRTAFKKIANEVDGRVPITFKKVRSPRVPGPMSVLIKEGASQYWFAALIDNHANPLTTVKVSNRGGAFRSAQRADYNYWIIDGGAGSGPFTIKITDVYGKTSTLSGIKMKPGVTQKAGGVTTSQAAPKKKPIAKKKPAAKKSPAPSPSVSKPAPVLESVTATSAAPPPIAPPAAPALTAKSCGT